MLHVWKRWNAPGRKAPPAARRIPPSMRLRPCYSILLTRKRVKTFLEKRPHTVTSFDRPGGPGRARRRFAGRRPQVGHGDGKVTVLPRYPSKGKKQSPAVESAGEIWGDFQGGGAARAMAGRFARCREHLRSVPTSCKRSRTVARLLRDMADRQHGDRCGGSGCYALGRAGSNRVTALRNSC